MDNNIEHAPLPKGIKLTTAVIAAALAMSGIVYLIWGPKDQNLERQEPALEYAGLDSRIAGIQFLLGQGLTFEQYKGVYHELTEDFSRIDPNAAFFNLVPDSIYYESRQSNADAGLSDEEIAAILSTLSGSGDHTATTFSDDESGSESEEDDNFDVIVFKMASDSNMEYTIKVAQNSSTAAVSIEIYDSAGQKVN